MFLWSKGHAREYRKTRHRTRGVDSPLDRVADANRIVQSAIFGLDISSAIYADVMAGQYRVTDRVRRANRIASWLSRRGLGRTVVLTTIGRRSGTPRPVPVAPIVVDGAEYIVSPYGIRAWVHNVRSNPDVRITKGRNERSARLVEVSGDEAAPVAAAYHERERLARRFMDVPADPSLEDFARAYEAFPVFRVV